MALVRVVLIRVSVALDRVSLTRFMLLDPKLTQVMAALVQATTVMVRGQEHKLMETLTLVMEETLVQAMGIPIKDMALVWPTLHLQILVIQAILIQVMELLIQVMLLVQQTPVRLSIEALCSPHQVMVVNQALILDTLQVQDMEVGQVLHQLDMAAG